MRKRILIVDDEAAPRRLAARILEEQYEVRQAGSASEALDLLAAHPFTLLLSDGCMPGTNGLELIAEVRRKFPEVICAMVSGAIDPERRSILEAGRVPYLEKPYHPKDLIALMAAAERLPT